jgi:hypothetical protein
VNNNIQKSCIANPFLGSHPAQERRAAAKPTRTTSWRMRIDAFNGTLFWEMALIDDVSCGVKLG